MDLVVSEVTTGTPCPAKEKHLHFFLYRLPYCLPSSQRSILLPSCQRRSFSSGKVRTVDAFLVASLFYNCGFQQLAAEPVWKRWLKIGTPRSGFQIWFHKIVLQAKQWNSLLRWGWVSKVSVYNSVQVPTVHHLHSFYLLNITTWKVAWVNFYLTDKGQYLKKVDILTISM